jgi:2-C-methyl-D-erythritol 4-phosphate cytidylyltransferase
MGKTLVYNISSPDDNDKRAAAIIAAAGNFTRMGGIPKQMVLLDNMPVIAHTIKSFQQAKHIREIVVVTRPDDVNQMMDICRKYSLNKVSTIVVGGSTRQRSVFNGINCTQGKTSFFAIHDGARPLIKPETIDKVVEYAWTYNAAVAAVHCKDTIKKADENGFVRDTPKRQFLWSAQTPQVFERELYLKAIESAISDGDDYTDDSQLIERLGHKVYLVESDYENIKITTPSDIAVAQAILEYRKDLIVNKEG